jgi:predicted DCC family thiol-disulfide oxidoreductase YuxK
VLYDADCGFCTWSAAQLRRMDRARRLELVPLQHAAAHPERPELAALAARSDLREVIHVVRPDGRVRAGGGAMLELLDALPGGWLLRPWALLPGVERLVDMAYRFVARRRGLFSELLARSGRALPACDLHPEPRAAPKVQRA